MEKSGTPVSDGFILRTDTKIVRFPDRHSDEHGAATWTRVTRLLNEVEVHAQRIAISGIQTTAAGPIELLSGMTSEPELLVAAIERRNRGWWEASEIYTFLLSIPSRRATGDDGCPEAWRLTLFALLKSTPIPCFDRHEPSPHRSQAPPLKGSPGSSLGR